MVHIHKKIRHHVAKYKPHITIASTAFAVLILLSSIFFITRGALPHASELAFTERSISAIGSVIPASCESTTQCGTQEESGYCWTVPGTDHGQTQTCWDGSVISTCSTCPAQPAPTCSNGGLPADQCACDAMNTSSYFTDECCQGTSGQRCGTVTRSCTNGGLSGAVCCPSGTTWNGSSCITPDCSNGATNPTACTTCPSGYVMVSGTCTYDSCAAMDPTQYCPSQSCTTLTGQTRTGTKNCACANGAINPTACTTCPSGYTMVSGNCTPNSVTPTTCEDTNANNYGGALPCTYDPTLDASLSQSTDTTFPGVSFTITWDSILASSCTVSYTGPDGGGVISTGPRSGTRTLTWSILGRYRITNTCTDGSGTASASRNHDVAAPDLTAGDVTPIVTMVGSNTVFSSDISNIGGESTNGNFYNFFQVATGPNGSGTITDKAGVLMNTLREGRTDDYRDNHIFSSTGTYSMRVCADKSSSGDMGTITEINASGTGENNNCGAWTTVNVTNGECPLPWGGTIPNGSSTTAYNTPTVVAPDRCTSHDQIRTCTNGVLSGSYLNPTCGAASPTVSVFSISPKTVEADGIVKLTWSIQNPTASCKISAAVQIPTSCDATCQANRAAASSTLNSALTTGTTNTNDPNGGNRNMTTAITTTVSGTYAKGEKSLNLDYSTNFTLTCGSAANTMKTLIYVTERTEG